MTFLGTRGCWIHEKILGRLEKMKMYGEVWSRRCDICMVLEDVKIYIS
jgi:hypothetical protein